LGYWDGTSFSTALVSGLAALVPRPTGWPKDRDFVRDRIVGQATVSSPSGLRIINVKNTVP